MNIYYQNFYLLLRYASMVCRLAHAAESALTDRILTEKNVKVQFLQPASHKTLLFLRRVENYFKHLGKGSGSWLEMWDMQERWRPNRM